MQKHTTASRLRTVSALVIDEVSMVSGDMFTQVRRWVHPTSCRCIYSVAQPQVAIC